MLVSTIDFFYPLVEDPYLQGRIGACNVLSDLYAMGVDEVDTVLMILAASLDRRPRSPLDSIFLPPGLCKAPNHLAECFPT